MTITSLLLIGLFYLCFNNNLYLRIKIVLIYLSSVQLAQDAMKSCDASDKEQDMKYVWSPIAYMTKT